MRKVEEVLEKLPKTEEELVRLCRDEKVKGVGTDCPLMVLTQPWMDDGLRIVFGVGEVVIVEERSTIDAKFLPLHIYNFVRNVDDNQYPDLWEKAILHTLE